MPSVRHACQLTVLSQHPGDGKMRRDHKSRSGKTDLSPLSDWGEPLLFLDQICHLATLAGSCGIKYIRTGTNGYLFRYSGQTDFSDRMKRLADQLAATPIRNIWVSIDSADAATHEKMRGLPGMIKGLEKALPILPNVDCTCQRTSGLTAILPAIKKISITSTTIFSISGSSVFIALSESLALPSPTSATRCTVPTMVLKTLFMPPQPMIAWSIFPMSKSCRCFRPCPTASRPSEGKSVYSPPAAVFTLFYNSTEDKLNGPAPAAVDSTFSSLTAATVMPIPAVTVAMKIWANLSIWILSASAIVTIAAAATGSVFATHPNCSALCRPLAALRQCCCDA